MATCADLFTRHGGHAGAAGFEIPTDRWDAFVARFEAIAGPAFRPIREPCCGSTWLCPPSTSTTDCCASSPGSRRTGPGNPEPLVAVLGLTVTRVRVAAEDHTSLTLRRDRDVLDGIAFGRADIAALVQEGDRIDVVARVTSRTFGGYESLQLEIRDAAPSGSHPEAAAVLAGPVVAVRRSGGVSRVAPRTPRARDPYGIGPVGSLVGPALSIVGLIVIAVITVNVFDGKIPFGWASGNGNGGQGSRRTAAPAPVERGRSSPSRPSSTARSSTPRRATSGSSRTRTCAR